MLSKMFARGLVASKSRVPVVMCSTQVRLFRTDFLNPYIHSPINLTEKERESQETKPVWERTFDFKKYMDHEGPLKVSGGTSLIEMISLALNWYCTS